MTMPGFTAEQSLTPHHGRYWQGWTGRPVAGVGAVHPQFPIIDPDLVSGILLSLLHG